MKMSKLVGITLKEELKKNPQLKESDIQYLKEWCSKQPHLPKISDSQLVLFLHSNYYRMEPTKVTIETFYTTRTHVPEFFSDRDPIGTKELRRIFKTIGITPLKGTTREGYSVMIGKLFDTDPSNYTYNEHIKYFFMSMDLWMYETGTTNGFIIFLDTRGVGFGHITRLSPLGFKKLLFYLQEAMPVRLEGLHYLVSNSVMEAIMNIMKPFMKTDLLSKVHLHSSIDSVAEYIPLEILPNELGGKAGNFDGLCAEDLRKLEENRLWFLDEEANSRVDESKRAGKQKSATDLFGVEGSFKKLDID